MNEYRSFAKERERLLKEIKQLPVGVQALKKLKFLREEYDWAIPDYRNSLNILSDTTYEDRKHFLLELIQNADDASFKVKKPELTFTIFEDGIELTYNEKGFDVNDVISITGTGASTKAAKKSNTNSFIGEKGIGFKSVFALASEVEIESYPWHFKLYKDKCIVPEVAEGGKLKSGDGTRLRVNFIDSDSVNIIAEELEKYVCREVESFLFLQKLCCFNVVDKRIGKERVNSLILENRRGNNRSLNTIPDGMTRKYSLYEEKILFSKELVSERWEKVGTAIGDIERSVIVAALVDSEEDVNEGKLFCFLPTEVSLPIPIFLQVDGHTKADRERLHDPVNNNWNKHIINELPQLLLRAILMWRENKNIAKKLPDFIPTNVGNDQLHEVFSRLKVLLKNSPWIKVFGSENEWVMPKEAIIADDYFIRLFKKYPDFRLEAEKAIGKKFIDSSWSSKERWKKTLKDYYDVHEMDIDDIIAIFTECIIPNEILYDDKNLTKLYKYILDMVPKYKAYSKIYNNSLPKKYKLAYAKIYPIEGVEGFTSLKDNVEDKVFWVSGNSKNDTGIESSLDYRVVNSEYTYTAKSSNDIIKETTTSIKVINERNEALRTILKYLEVPELTDEALFKELQLPWLLEKPCSIHKELISKFKVFMSAFNGFISKKTHEEEYLIKLSELGKAKFMGEDENSYNLSDLLLPDKLKIETEDYLYDGCELQCMKIPPSVLKILSGKKVEFRNFLIHCGIKTKPGFKIVTTTYANASDFNTKSKVQYLRWIKEIGRNYTSHKSIELKSIELDDATKRVLSLSNGNTKELANQIYISWKKYFIKQKDGEIFPGHYLIKYTRYETRTILFEDKKWAGLFREDVPIITLGNELKKSSMVFRCSKLENEYLRKILSKLDVVIEDEVEGYSTKYLNSLNIRDISLLDLNKLWDRVNADEYDDIIKLAIEIIKLYGEVPGLQVYDKEKKKLRNISEFRIGEIASSGIPLISKQYGEFGERLGRLLNLREEREIKTYKRIFDKVFSEEFQYDQEAKKAFYMLLKNWHKWGQADKGKMAQQLEKRLQELGYAYKPVIVFNDKEKLRLLKESSILVVGMDIENIEEESFELEKASRELGFVLGEECGQLILEEQKPLNDEEIEKFNFIMQMYLEEIEIGESARLKTLFLSFGGVESLYSRVFRVKAASRIIDFKSNLSIDIALPYLDYDENRIVVDKYLSVPNIIINMLTMFQFTTLRSARRDIEEINEKYISNKAYKIDSNRLSKEKQDSLKGINNTKVNMVSKVASEIENALVDKIEYPVFLDEDSQWKCGIDSEEEEQLRGNLINTIEDSLNSGPEIFEKKIKKCNAKKEKGVEKEKINIVDPSTLNAKEFLIAEYGGRCQVCGTKLTIHNGSNYINVFRIREKRNGEAWWGDRPFNILAMCPNCHTLAKHGGRDFSNLYKAARELLDGDIFPIEVKKFNGDYYVVDITINKKVKKITMSKVHMNYLAALIEGNESVNEIASDKKTD